MKVTFYPEQVKYGKDVAPFMTVTPRAARTATGSISLSERVFIFEDFYRRDHKDVVVVVEVDGREVYRDKAKYPEASALGVRRDGHGWFIDELRTPG